MILDPRKPPANVEAEQALLGAILVDNRAFEPVSFLRPEHFADPVHGRIFSTIARLRQDGQLADPLTLQSMFAGDPDLTERGGAVYLARLAASCVTIINAEHYGRTLVHLSRYRAVMDMAQDAYESAQRAEQESPDELIRQMHEALDGLSVDPAAQHRAVTAGDAAASLLAALGEGRGRGISTGLDALDRIIGGLRKGQAIVLAGATGMGKSGAALGMAWAACEHGTVPFFSLEMSAEDVAARMLSIRSGVPLWRVAQNRLHPDEVERLHEAARTLNDVPITFECSAAPTVRDLRRRAADLARKGPISLIVVDYLQLMCGEERADNRTAEVASITRGLKVLAKDLDVPVLALSQLSRKVDARDNKRPELGDLRESGSIEQDADVVMFCYRPAYYLERKKPAQTIGESGAAYRDKITAWEADIREADNAAEIIVAKQRQGAANRSATVRFERDTAQFIDPPAPQSGAAQATMGW